MAVSRLPGPNRPNHKETENKKDRNAAVKMNNSDLSSFISKKLFRAKIPIAKIKLHVLFRWRDGFGFRISSGEMGSSHFDLAPGRTIIGESDN